MDTAIHQEDGAPLTVSGLGYDTTWGVSGQSGQDPGSNILYIAVGYVKDDDLKLEGEAALLQEQAVQFADFEDHVSPLDPNMSSVARYSPVYTAADSASYGNSVVVTQLVSDPTTEQTDANFVGNLGVPVVEMGTTDLQQNVGNTRFLQMVNDSNTGIIESTPANTLSMISDAEQEEVLLITDQTTGISYSVGPEFMVERCLTDEQQLLEALAPDPLLEADLLTLDENSLKAQLSEIVIDTQTLSQQVDPLRQALQKAANNNVNNVKCEREEESFDFINESLRRSQRQLEFLSTVESEEQLLNCVQTITDKPVPTRARATLPESHLIIQKKNDGYSVFAKKLITKATQFGPLEGKYVSPVLKLESEALELKVQNKAGEIYHLDISDENTSNWMCFVKTAKTYEEQNLVVVQQEEHLYYVSTKNIQPKQELLVSYSSSYAKKYQLPVLEQPIEERMSWNCFECNMCFETSQDLQKHLNVHDDETDENIKPKKRLLKRKLLLKNRQKPDSLECIFCGEIFNFPKFSVIKKHMISHGIEGDASIHEHFKTIRNLRCEDCNLSFDFEDELNTHNKQHEQENPEKLGCNICSEKFPTLRKLDIHKATVHSGNKKPLRCPACYKIFASQDRMRRHMVLHASEDSKPYQCTKCPKRFLSTSALACHEKCHLTDRKVFECPICRERFLQIIQLKQHTQKHCIDDKFTCPYCNKIFTKYSIIRKHIRAFHCEKKHYCSECTKTFPTLDKLKMHLLRHSDHREFLCADCGKQFKRKDKLNEHCRRMHTEERENAVPSLPKQQDVQQSKKFTPKVQPTDYHRFIYKCHTCLIGFKRRGMLVNHLAKRHPEISPETVPELNLPILRTTRDYYCQYCDKIYKSSSKRKAHILKIHPGFELPMSNRKLGSNGDNASLPNPTYSQTVGSITTHPQSCQWCHKQYASKAKLLQHQRKKHTDLLKLTDNGYYNEDKPRFVKLESEQCDQFKKSMKVTDLLSEMVNLDQDREDGNYYHVVPVSTIDGTVSQNGDFTVPDSRLYRLLTTGNNLAPPR